MPEWKFKRGAYTAKERRGFAELIDRLPDDITSLWPSYTEDSGDLANCGGRCRTCVAAEASVAEKTWRAERQLNPEAQEPTQLTAFKLWKQLGEPMATKSDSKEEKTGARGGKVAATKEQIQAYVEGAAKGGDTVRPNDVKRKLRDDGFMVGMVQKEQIAAAVKRLPKTGDAAKASARTPGPKAETTVTAAVEKTVEAADAVKEAAIEVKEVVGDTKTATREERVAAADKRSAARTAKGRADVTPLPKQTDSRRARAAKNKADVA